MSFYKNIFLFALLFSIGHLSAQKIAYVEETKILKEIKDYEKNLIEIDSLKKDFTSQINIEAEEISKKLELLTKNYKPKENETFDELKNRMKPADAEKLDMHRKESELVNLKAKNYNATLEALYKDKIQPELDRVNNAIKVYAKKNKFVMIYKYDNINSALAYLDESLDKTQDIIQLIKK